MFGFGRDTREKTVGWSSAIKCSQRVCVCEIFNEWHKGREKRINSCEYWIWQLQNQTAVLFPIYTIEYKNVGSVHCSTLFDNSRCISIKSIKLVSFLNWHIAFGVYVHWYTCFVCLAHQEVQAIFYPERAIDVECLQLPSWNIHSIFSYFAHVSWFVMVTAIIFQHFLVLGMGMLSVAVCMVTKTRSSTHTRTSL